MRERGVMRHYHVEMNPGECEREVMGHANAHMKSYDCDSCDSTYHVEMKSGE